MSLLAPDVLWPGLFAALVAGGVIYNLYVVFDAMFEGAVGQMQRVEAGGVAPPEDPAATARVTQGFFAVVMLFLICEGGVAFGFNRVVEALRGKESVLLSLELARTARVPFYPVLMALGMVGFLWGDQPLLRRIAPVMVGGLVLTLMAHGVLLTPW